MKRRTIFGVTALTGLLLLAATGCEKTPTKQPAKTPTPGQTETQQPTSGEVEYTRPNLGGRKMNVYVNYDAKSGATFTGKYKESYTNPFDGQTYVAGNLLPMWKEIQTRLNCTINDSVWDFEKDAYSKKSSKDQWTTVLSAEANFGEIDFLMTGNAEATAMAKEGKLVNLVEYINYMPNFKKFLLDNPAVKSEITTIEGKIFMLPYFDGINTPEKMNIINTEFVEKLLDDDAASYDTTSAKATAYSAFIDTSKDQEVLISVKGKAEEITIKAAKNPVTAQNELATKNGKTYVEALKAYIDAAYMPSGKYAKRSEVFTAEHACYTVDDLVALLRCAVNNSAYLYGTPNSVYGLIPRGGKDSRIDTMLYFTSAWGVRGVNSEKEHMYFDGEGKLKDARIQQATYDALGYMHQLYQEGLIMDNFSVEGKDNDYNQRFLSGKDGKAALLMYDYNAAQASCNKVDENGIGLDGSKYNGIMPILPPLTYWAEDNINGKATGGKGYELTRYTEDARSNKGAGTVIPTFDGKDREQIIAACQLADYFYSVEGGLLQDFGPSEYTEGEVVLSGVAYPKYKPLVISEINSSGLSWNNYMRAYMGTTQGLGHVRSDAVDYECTHVAGQVGLNNLMTAVNSGAVTCATTTRAAGFGAMVPAVWDSSPSDNTDKYALVETFFKRAVGNDGWRGVVLNGWEDSATSQKNLKDAAAAIEQYYLAYYQRLYDNKH